MWKHGLAGIVLALCAMPVFASQCPTLMNDIDELLNDDAVVSDLSASELEQVRELRAEGERQHQNGKHSESVDTLNEALAILGEEEGSGGYSSY